MDYIFAKKGTSEKVLLNCHNGHVGDAMTALKLKYGGEWVMVDKLMPYRDGLKFDDGDVYCGYDGRDGRFSKFIIQVDLT